MEALQRIIDAARNHPFYREALLAARTFEDCPVLEKSSLYDHIQEGMRTTAFRQGTYFSPTGGTATGRPLYFPSDIRENKQQREVLARRLSSSGILGNLTIALNLFPTGRLIRSLEIFNDYCDSCGATVLPVGAHVADADAWRTADQFGATMVAGMPSRLIAFARWLEANGQKPSFESVLFGGEFLHPQKRRKLKAVLGGCRFSGIYGSAEMGVVAYHPAVGDPPVYHFPRDLTHLEIQNPNVAGFGQLVVTNLVRLRHPLLRYDTGDVGRLVGHDADEVWIELKCRSGDSFTIGGDYYHFNEFAAVLSRFLQSQVVINFDDGAARDRITFRLVTDGPLPEERRQEVTTAIRALLEADDQAYLTEVQFVVPEVLLRRPGSLKVPLVVDLRSEENPP